LAQKDYDQKRTYEEAFLVVEAFLLVEEASSSA
jgi:hypothetical protein